MPRYGDDLRAIVGIDKIKKEIKELSDKVQILGQRGVGYQTPDGAVAAASGAAGAAGGVTAPSNAKGATGGIGSESAIAGALSGASQAVNGAGGNIKGSEDGLFDLADILDNSLDSVAAGVMDGIDVFSQNVSAINGWTDPTTGKAGTVRLDGYGVVPPEDWDDANTPGPDTSWVFGKYWLFGGAFFGATWGDLIADAAAQGYEIRSNAATTAPGYYYQNSGAPVIGDTLAAYTEANRVLNGVPSYSGFTYITSGSSGYGPAGDCPAPTGYTCLSTAPTASAFPVTDSFQIFQNPLTGEYEGSAYDTEVPPTYVGNSSSTVYMGFASGREAIIKTGVNGVKLLYEVTPGTTTPISSTASVHVINSRGQLLDVIQASQLSRYLKN